HGHSFQNGYQTTHYHSIWECPIPSEATHPQRAANWFLAQWQDLFADTGKPVSFALWRAMTYVDFSVVEYGQMYAGVEVLDARVGIVADHSGGINSVTADILIDTSPLDTGTVSTTPSIDAADAQNRAVAYVAERYGWKGLEPLVPTLMIYAPAVTSTSGPVRLIWSIEVHGASPGIRRRVFVDAHSGEVVREFSLIKMT
ncbi:MAG: hypothetical protein JW955_26210, partial [Sedimentisphaerales bacterium]|nr:hypothetical protein [Sedimentisphaerales bacterium]